MRSSHIDMAYFSSIMLAQGNQQAGTLSKQYDELAQELECNSANYLTFQHQHSSTQWLNISALFHGIIKPLKLASRLGDMSTQKREKRNVHIFSLGETTLYGSRIGMFDGTHVKNCRRSRWARLSHDMFDEKLRSYSVQIITGIREIDMLLKTATRAFEQYHIFAYDPANVNDTNVAAWRQATLSYQNTIDDAVLLLGEWLQWAPKDDDTLFDKFAVCSLLVTQELKIALGKIEAVQAECSRQMPQVQDRSVEISCLLNMISARKTFEMKQVEQEAEWMIADANYVMLSSRLAELREANQRKVGQLDGACAVIIGLSTGVLATLVSVLNNWTSNGVFPIILAGLCIVAIVAAIFCSVISYTTGGPEVPLFADQEKHGPTDDSNKEKSVISYEYQSTFACGRHFATKVNLASNQKEQMKLTVLDYGAAAEVVSLAKKIGRKKYVSRFAIELFLVAVVLFLATLAQYLNGGACELFIPLVGISACAALVIHERAFS